MPEPLDVRQNSNRHNDRIEEYEQAVRNSPEYRGQRKRLAQVVSDFAFAAEVSAMTFTRYPHSDVWMVSRLTTELQESIVAVYSLATSGVFNTGRRELRYMIESATKYVHVDQRLSGEATIDDREKYLHSHVPRSSVSIIDNTTLRMVSPEEFRNAVKLTFNELSAYVHPSKRQLQERRRKLEKGESPGFELPKSVEKFTANLIRTCDLLLALIFEGVGPSFTGDIYVQILADRPDWRFHKTRFCMDISKTFDYKWERQVKGTNSP